MIYLEVLGRPVVWKAPRVTRRGTFSEHTQKKIEAQWQLKAQYQADPLEGDLSITFKFLFTPPRGLSQKKHLELIDTGFNKRPDISNLEKFACDCGNGILWLDDKQIIKMTAEKIYATKEKTIIIIEPYLDDEL